ncbi:MAG: flagellin [Caldisphaeraceae archaeon]|nr:flagellin [Caldisphaeraceae archaeon]
MAVGRKKRGMVGIDTAIILIAFVLVAVAVAFVTLDMGMTSATKAKQTMVNGLQEASTALQVNGEVLAVTNGSGDVEEVTIPLGVTPGSGYVSFDNTTFSVSVVDQYGSYPNVYVGVVGAIGSSTNLSALYNGQNLTTPEAKVYFITGNITPTILGPYGQALLVVVLPQNSSLTAYHTIQVTIKPSIGGALTVSRIIPPNDVASSTIDLG